MNNEWVQCFLVLFCSAAVIFGCITLYHFINLKKRVISKEVFVFKKEIVTGLLMSQGRAVARYRVRFAYKDGIGQRKIMSFFISEPIYKQMPEKTYGMLTFRGEVPLSFISDGLTIEF